MPLSMDVKDPLSYKNITNIVWHHLYAESKKAKQRVQCGFQELGLGVIEKVRVERLHPWSLKMKTSTFWELMYSMVIICHNTVLYASKLLRDETLKVPTTK